MTGVVLTCVGDMHITVNTNKAFTRFCMDFDITADRMRITGQR